MYTQESCSHRSLPAFQAMQRGAIFRDSLPTRAIHFDKVATAYSNSCSCHTSLLRVRTLSGQDAALDCGNTPEGERKVGISDSP
jgi:hypothetical protein